MEPTGPQQEHEQPISRGVAIRILTGLALAGLVLGTLFTSRRAWVTVVVVAVLFAQWELYRALAATGVRPATGLGLVAGAVMMIGAHQGGTSALAFAITMSIAAIFLWFLADPHRTDASERIGLTILGLVYVPFLGAHVVLMRDLLHGPALTVAYIGLTAFYDIGAFAGGSFFGRHPIAPSVSPRKTWEGAAAGTFVVLVLALAVGPFIDPFTVPVALGLAIITALVAPMGDLAESLIKRDLGIKDMGSMLPGHGGLLDRIDALLFMAPAAYWYLRLVL